MKKYAWLSGMVLVVGLGITQAGEKENKADTAQSAVPVATADSVAFMMEQWYQAVLNGSDSESNDLERRILRLLTIDLNQTRERLMKILASAPQNEQSTDASFANAKADSGASSLNDSVEFLRSAVNVKRLLVESIAKSDAFSYKYRLLGDYVELIRRDVGLPKLKLASEKDAPEISKN